MQISKSHGVKVNLIGAPTHLGCDREGPQLAPDYLRDHGIFRRLQGRGCDVYDLGNLHLPEPEPGDKFAGARDMKYLQAITEMDRNLAEAVYASAASGAVPLTLGGDHSVALGSISGSASFHKNLGVIWIDAHGDINTNESSPSGNVHGMILAALMGFGDQRLVNLYRTGRKIDPLNVFLFGVRSLDPGEIRLIEREGIKIWHMEDIRNAGIEVAVAQLMQAVRARGVTHLHCSLDIDVVDPKFAPGTGTTVKNGMAPQELIYTVENMNRNLNMVSWDIVEINPLLDKNDKTTELVISLAENIVTGTGSSTLFV